MDVGRTKEDFDPQLQALVRAMAKVLYGGDEEAAWRDVIAQADNTERLRAESKTQRMATRLHFKATHGA